MGKPDLSGQIVIITDGEFVGEEGVCLGRAPDSKDLWAVSPHVSRRVVNLKFDEEFGLLINPGQKPGTN